MTSVVTEAPEFGIYVHWPFCASKCPYCDFNSHVVRGVDQTAMLEDLCTDLQSFARQTEGRTVNSIFFGGGTPSLMEGKTLSGVLEEIARLWSFAPDIEISMEANPSSVDASRFAAYASAGVSRLSLGVQALNDGALTKLGRLHNVDEALDAIDLAMENFPRVSFDLIYARPGQTEADWARELERALGLGATHMSLYQLTFETGTMFETLRRAGKIIPLDDDISADLYEVTSDLCSKAGLPAYEISNHAAPGQECRHNMIYWRMHDYIGVGPGAHGRFGTGSGSKAVRIGSECIADPKAWSSQVRAGGAGLKTTEEVSLADQATEMMLMGLRLAEGVSLGRYESLAGSPLPEASIKTLEAQSLVLRTDGRLRATPQGRPVLNSILRELLA